MASVSYRQSPNTFRTTSTGGTLDPSMFITSIQDVMEVVRDSSCPLVDAIGFGEALDNPEPIVIQKLERQNVAVLGASMDNTQTTMTVQTGQFNRFFQYGVWQLIDYIGSPANGILNYATDERVYITASPTTEAVTVVRGYGNGNKYAHAAGALLRFIAPAQPQNTNFVITPTRKGDQTRFFFQNMQEVAETGWEARNTPTYEDRTDIHLLDVKEKTWQLKRALDNNGWLGTANAGSAVSPESFAGLNELVQNRLDLAGAALKYSTINDFLINRWDATGPETTKGALWMSARTKQFINTFGRTFRRSTIDNAKYADVINELTFDTGTYPIKYHKNVPDGKIYFLSENNLSFHPYKNEAFAAHKVETLGNYDRTAIYGRYTLILKKPSTHGVLENFSLTKTDYPTDPT